MIVLVLMFFGFVSYNKDQIKYINLKNNQILAIKILLNTSDDSHLF